MSHLDNGFRSLTLQRFPATDDVNPLQAWEAADEYLLQQLDDTEIRGPVLILNDAFGDFRAARRFLSYRHGDCRNSCHTQAAQDLGSGSSGCRCRSLPSGRDFLRKAGLGRCRPAHEADAEARKEV